MVQWYAEPLCRRHYAGVFSGATVVRVGLLLINIAVSLVVSFATGGFWVKVKPTISQPTVHFTYDALLFFQGSDASKERFWSTSSQLNAQYSSNAAAASIQAGEEDWNFDGVPDAIVFRARVSGVNPVYGVKALLQFNYSFSGTVWLDMYSMAYYAYSSSVPGGSLYTDGDLLLQQRTAITARRYNGVYNSPILNSTSSGFTTAVQPQLTLDLANILSVYLDRNYTTTYANVVPVWQASSGNEFVLTMYIRVPPNQIIWYRPQVIEMLKFGWIQFLATYVVLWWVFTYLQRFIFRYRIVTTHVVSDVLPKPQRF